ncbi:hypothetical protein POM88_045184 [Heracleum sosnowskyi]|uniref:Ubiquitin-like protease family profile domain-containing protein n=1 Tax=Heracleum sosnowskyi TaxID=360622 RepID=A0AAD8H472_9APIA|nr:hypothetical protein POM88_045184 [Heracleum sosnowskyi]
MSLTKEKLLTLKPGNLLEDSIVNAYVEILKIRENNLWYPNHIKTDNPYSFHAVLKPTAKRFFFAFSWWMVIAAQFCYDLKIPPSEMTGAAKDDRDNFIKTYQKQFIGPNLQDCDFAFFPACHCNHWILFVADIKKAKVLLIDPLRNGDDYSGKLIYPTQYYLMEKFLPFMLHKLDDKQFPQRYMIIKEVVERPKQEGGVDCGVFVCKYMDAICNGISLKTAYWTPDKDVITFRYRIANELRNGEARLISEWGIRQKNLGL